MKKVIIIFLMIIMASASTAEAGVGKYVSRLLGYGITHHPDWSNMEYYWIDEVPTEVPTEVTDTINIGTGTAYDTSLSDRDAMSDFLAFLGIFGACLGLWFLYLEVVAPKRKRKTPKQAPVNASGY